MSKVFVFFPLFGEMSCFKRYRASSSKLELKVKYLAYILRKSALKKTIFSQLFRHVGYFEKAFIVDLDLFKSPFCVVLAANS